MVTKIEKRIQYAKNLKEAETKKKSKPINKKTETTTETKTESNEE